MTQRRFPRQQPAGISIDAALLDPQLLGAALGDSASWQVWVAVLKAAFGQQLTETELHTFASVAGGRPPPTRRVRELWAVCGRRSGKSRVAAALAVFAACFVPHRLSAGERGTVLVLAASQAQARAVFEYALAFLLESPVLRQEVQGTTRHEIRLKSGVTIAIHPNSFRSIRGRTLLACVFDEIAFWRDETSATPDQEVYRAVLPALLTQNGMLVGISSPYRRTGLLHAKHKRYFGQPDDDALVVSGTSQQFNPTLTAAAIAAQREADPTAAASEWDAQFRDDLVGLFDEPVIDGSVNRARPLELPPRAGVRYVAHVDASGGAAGGDRYAIAIAHKEDGIYVVDLVRARQGPFDPELVTQEYAALCRDEYHVMTVRGDYYGAEWVATSWRRHSISYQRSDLPTSQLYLETLPLFMRNLVSLPDHQPLIRELLLLERSPQRSGKDQVTHPRGTHDDMACVCAGALHQLAKFNPNWIDALADAAPEEPEAPPHRHPNGYVETAAEYWSGLGEQISNYSRGQFWPA